MPPKVILDGRDPLPVLTGGATSPHPSLYFTFRSHAALRMGDWKIVRTEPTQNWMLYDLRADISESKDRAAANPARVSALAAEFGRWHDSVTAGR